MSTELEKRGLTTVEFKKKCPKLHQFIFNKYGGSDNIFDFAAAFTLYVNHADWPHCDVCNQPLTITKKYRQGVNGPQRCSKHINTNHQITRDQIHNGNNHGYRILDIPDKILTKTDTITVECPSHGQYQTSIRNFLLGRQCQKCYHHSMLGRKGVIHSDETKKNLSLAKSGKTPNISEKSKKTKIRKQKQRWAERKADKESFAKYLNKLSLQRKEYIKQNGFIFPRKEKTGLEKTFEKYLNDHGVSYYTQYVLGGRKFDFLLSDYNLLVEVDGEYWHRLPPSMKNDAVKQEISKEHKMTLLRISSDDFRPELIFEDSETQERHTKQLLRARGIDGF